LLDIADSPYHFAGMLVVDTIRRKLTDRFAPIRLEVEDESHRHIGHEGARPGGETHFAVTIVSAAFIGQSRVARQRLVYETLANELATRIHALSLTTLAPVEAAPHPNPLPAGGEREGPASAGG
jgi:BolA family transcriptional regulator, general stress-responsive regulator